MIYLERAQAALGPESGQKGVKIRKHAGNKKREVKKGGRHVGGGDNGKSLHRQRALASLRARCIGGIRTQSSELPRMPPNCFTSASKHAYSSGTWQLASNAADPDPVQRADVKQRPWLSCNGTRHMKHEWQPQCHLKRMERPELCALLSGKFVLLVGDSTSQQVFLTLVSVMRGEMSRFGSGRDRASACNDTVRIMQARSDLLLWSDQVADFQAPTRCNSAVLGSAWTRRAAMADLVLLSVGQHFAGLDKSAAVTQGEDAAEKTARLAFFSASLEHTLRGAAAARAAAGHLPNSMILVGASLPTPGCSRFQEPISLAQWLRADAALPAGLARYAQSWRHLPRQNHVARWTAESLNVPFLDIASLTAQRPDATMAHTQLNASGVSSDNEDCVHFCLPGPVRDIIKLLGNLLTAHARGNALWPMEGATKSRAFSISRRDWLGGNTARDDPDSDNPVALEAVPRMHDWPKRNRSRELAAYWWWPFGKCTWMKLD